LFLFTGFFAAILIRMRRTMMRQAGVDRNVTLCIRALFATLVAMLVTIATVSSAGFIPYLYWSFAGLCVALVRVTSREEVAKLQSLCANRPSVHGSAPGLPFGR
jgi:tryptophan-rich sensory protein